MPQYVAQIFDEEPIQWGLRGDSLFWQELRQYYSGVELPYPPTQLQEDIVALFKQNTGSTPIMGKNFFVKKYAATHVGMSTGTVNSQFWLQKGIPLLCNRLTQANFDLQALG